ncbi:asparagine synthase (glutamine-hydrolyzing) [Stieleria varia]|uniref:asparagine synthase (glutamine-hydrolyzing) n=1 Tax=Stieleria varia TaxID=2528005 RepID=A0A5C6AH44_9BACT|nr:asparagine synthase (glutamine-hydrolyzing) [Stieleria varia]TWT98628.1 Asparagine synthetase [glutamine-hydrolyzing] 1 [Stieleria varia]
MCGIFALFDSNETEIDPSRVREATETLSHRGPDFSDAIVDEHVGLGHTRLSIVDLTAGANQPFTIDGGRFTLVYNGEIYNFAQLKSELEALGVRFRTHCDTEVLAYGLKHWGVDCLRKLNGIFAFAFWDRDAKTLTVARDRLGVKPLYLYSHGGQLVLASEIKAILHAVPELKREVQFQAFSEFLQFGVSLGGKTLFAGISQLPPASYAIWSRGDQSPVTGVYWYPEPGGYSGTVGDAIEETRERLEAAVRSQLTGDVPIGVFLSGGLDSSAITAFASRHYPGKLRTFSVAFDFADKSELELAKLVAERFDTEHHEVQVSGFGLEATVSALVECHDLPFGDSANIPLYLLCRQNLADIKVVLQGDGGDELFGGYRRYRTLTHEAFYRCIAQVLRIPGISGALPQRLSRYLQCFLPKNRGDRFARLLTTETSTERLSGVFSDGIGRRLLDQQPFERYKEIAGKYSSLDSVQAMLLTDLEIVLPDVFLEKVDRASMANGIEVRVPLLENDLVDFAVSLPSSFKVRSGVQKWLLRESLSGIVPSEILTARKSGFGVPYSAWLRGPLNEMARDHFAGMAEKGMLKQSAVDAMLARHQSGSERDAFFLWKLFQLAIWFDKYQVAM